MAAIPSASASSTDAIANYINANFKTELTKLELFFIGRIKYQLMM
jgi:hypothetical protein